MTDNRTADARDEARNFRDEANLAKTANTQPLYVDAITGEARDASELIQLKDPKTGRITTFNPPRLTPQEEQAAAAALRGALEAGTIRYPLLAQSLLRDPARLWRLAELQFMLSPEPNEVSYDFTAELAQGLDTTTGQRYDYQNETIHEPTQQLFWNEVGSLYGPTERDVIINALAQLTPRGANQVAAMSLLWSEERDMTDEEEQAQGFLNIMNWTFKEQEHEAGQTGFFGFIDAAQEAVEHKIVSPLINAGVGLLSGPEDAARRRDLTVGRQIAFMFGLRPPDQVGEFGWWEFVSGGADALVEIGADPLSWLAGLGLGAKAAKIVPLSMKATRIGRATAALQALLPKPFTGAARAVSGGRFARVTYALTAKSIDDLMEQTLKNGVAQEALDLVKQGNLSRFARLYPAWSRVDEETINVIQSSVESPREFLEIMKSSALNGDVLQKGLEGEELLSNAHRSENAMRQFLVDAGRLSEPEDQLARQARSNWNYTSEQLRPTFEGLLSGADNLDPTSLDKVRALSKWWDANQETPGGLVRALNQTEIDDLLAKGKGGSYQIGMASSDKGGAFASGARGQGWTARFDNATPAARNELNQIEAAKGGDEWLVSGNFRIRSINKKTKIIRLDYDSPTFPNPATRSFSDLIGDQSIPRDLRLQAGKDKLMHQAFSARGQNAFILSEIPQKSKRVFSWQKVLNIQGTSRLATGVRRTAARITPGRIPHELHLFDTRKGTDDLRRIGEHFGLEQAIIDDLINDFRNLDLGARQDWVWDTFMRRIGHETGVPAFEHQLIQFYKRSGVRSYSGSGVDFLPDGSRIPLLSSQMATTMPIPVEEITQVFARARSIGTRSKLAEAIGFNGRGLGGTASRRTAMVNRLRRELGEDAAGLSDEHLYDMAYSMVSPDAGLDGRGFWTGRFFPKAGSLYGNVHSWFTKSMLVFRPFQWMWRVAMLEEPIRAHIWNLPSFYRNPLAYMARAREAHYVANVRKWAELNASWGQEIMGTVLKGKRSDILNRIQDLGLMDEIFQGKIPSGSQQVRRMVERYIENAIYGRTNITRLSPIRRVPWSVKNQSHNIAKAEKMLDRLNLPNSFDFAQETSEITGRLVAQYLGEAVGSTYRHLYQWLPGMARDEAYTHGRVWGSKLVEFVEDPLARMALHRRAALLRGATPDIGGSSLINHSRWEVMAPDLRLKYGQMNDVDLAERYMDDMLSKEMDHLFAPFFNSLDRNQMADLLDEFATSRQISATIAGQAVDWDLRGANYAGGLRQVGDFTAAMRTDGSVPIPSNLSSPSFDPRFMAEDSPGYAARMARWVLHTFGERATQTINRRPAWVHSYDRWYRNYTNLGIPEEHARRLATDHANEIVNHVFFNMQEAPYYVARLNRILPFFGATYEVLSTWSYKMPVAVGGTWQMGAGEFARKFDRLIDGLVNIGVLDREVNEEGDTNIVLNLVPPDSDSADINEFGRFFQGAGFAAVNTLDQAVSTILGLEEGLGLRSQGYRMAVGHPLDPTNFGMLSFAQAQIGLNPLANIAVNTLAARIPGAGGPRRVAVEEGETLADVAIRLEIDVNELVRYNREIFLDKEGFGSADLYRALLSGDADPTTVVMPVAALNLPGSSLWDAFRDVFMPFGETDTPHEFASSFLPAVLRWVMAGIALQNQPTDSFWKDSELDGVFGGLLPHINEAQVASQLNEAFMYLEAHDLENGKGPLTRIMEKEAEIVELLNAGDEVAANDKREELQGDIEAFLDKAQKTAAESLILRGLTGSMLPSSPGHVRLEEQLIRDFWDTREYVDSLRIGSGEVKLRNFRSMEEYDQHKEMLAAWLSDPTGDRARATFYANNPQLMAYLTPKTFYKDPVPEITSFEEYQRQIESGEREPAPLHVTMWRARSAAIQADYYNKYIANFGNDPLQAAATALQNRSVYEALQDERNLEYDALELWDDMHGGVYDAWRQENYQDTKTWAQDQITDKLNAVRDNLNILLELEDNLDIEIDLEGIDNLNQTIRGAIAEIGSAIRSYEDLTEKTDNRNAYEVAINRYFEEVYLPYAERVADLYDQLPEVGDSERQSLVFEQIKLLKNEYAGQMVFLDDDTTTPFPNPLEYAWQGKSPEEQIVKMQQWITRPVEWMDLDQAIRLINNNPNLQGYLPSTREDFDIYREFTLTKIEIDEMFEANEITRSQRNRAMKNLEKELYVRLNEQGRGNEILMTTLTPYEKLELSGLLPAPLGIFGDHVRYYKQALESHQETPGSVNGRRITAPLYDLVEEAFYTDPTMRSTLQDLGLNLQDKTVMDSFLPWLFFGYTGER